MKPQKLLPNMFIALLMSSCSVGPSAYLADGSRINTGGSFATSGEAESRRVSMPNGLNASWDRNNWEETSVLKVGIGVLGTGYGLKQLASVKNAITAANSKNLVTTTNGATAQAALSKAEAGSTITAPGVTIIPPAPEPVVPPPAGP